MCIKCDGYSDEEILRGMDLTIQVYGFYIQGVVENPDGVGNWAYTVGLADFEIPELILTDHTFERSVHLINLVGRRVVQGQSLESALIDSDFTLGRVHDDHIAQGLVAMWPEYYGEMRAGRLPSSVTFRQLIPGGSHDTMTSGRPPTDLARSC